MIGLPEDLYLQCERIVKSGRHGYASVSEIVKESVRRRLEDLNHQFQAAQKEKESER
jgi:Arc/MetJ-type ribon-helix-helix transcriptional regulator